MISALAILKDKSGSTIGAKFLINNQEYIFKTAELIQADWKNNVINAIIDSNGFVKAKQGYDSLIKQVVINEKQNKQEIYLYHGSNKDDLVPKFGYGKANNDYGRGFYTTPDEELAKEWAMVYYKTTKTGYCYAYKLDTHNLNLLDLRKYRLENWIAELLTNRKVNIEYEVTKDRLTKFIRMFKLDTSKADIIIGYRADDSYFRYAEDFINGLIYKETIEKAMQLGSLGIQVFVKSEEAFDRLELMQKDKVESKYFSLYSKRDADAREVYKKIKTNQTSEKVTIDDILRNEVL